VETEPLGEFSDLVPRQVEQECVAVAEDDEIENDFALGRQQGGIDGTVSASVGNVCRHQVVEKFLRVAAADRDYRAPVEPRNSPIRCRPTLRRHGALRKRVRTAGQGREDPALAETFDVVFKGATVVNHDGSGVRDIAARNGRIAAIGEVGEQLAGEVVDCRGLHILPGVIDTQVHFREPGAPHKEDLESGSRSAVMGGVTAVFEMPNTRPPTTTAEALADKVTRARGRMHCDFAFFVGASAGNAADIAELERLPGAAGIKIFMGSSTGDLLVADDATLRAILSRTRRRVSVHAEDEA